MKMKMVLILISFMAVTNIAMARYDGTVKGWVNYLKQTYGIELPRPTECTKLSYCYEWKWARKRRIKELRIIADRMGIVLDESMVNKYLNHKCSDCSQVDNDKYNRMESAYLNGNRSSSSGVSNGKSKNRSKSRSSNSGMRAYRTYRRTGGYKGYRGGW